MKHASAGDLLKRLPGPVSLKWPQGEQFATALANGSMSVELFAPRGVDPQTPHSQDELYFIQSGNAIFTLEAERIACSAGDVLFVPAGADHRFGNFSDDFATWVVFWGPIGGERMQP